MTIFFATSSFIDVRLVKTSRNQKMKETSVWKSLQRSTYDVADRLRLKSSDWFTERYSQRRGISINNTLSSLSSQPSVKPISIQPLRHQPLSSLSPRRSFEISVPRWIFHQVLHFPRFQTILLRKLLSICIPSSQNDSLESDRHEWCWFERRRSKV